MKKTYCENENVVIDHIKSFINDSRFDEAMDAVDEAANKYILSSGTIETIYDLKRMVRNLKRNPEKQEYLPLSSQSKTFKPVCYGVFDNETESAHLDYVIKTIEKAKAKIISDANKSKARKSDTKVDIQHGNLEDRISASREYSSIQNRSVDEEINAQMADISLKKPYIGRLDFNDKKVKRIIYISDTCTEKFVDPHGGVNYVDWRAPIADLFYRYQIPTKDASFTINRSSSDSEQVYGEINLIARYAIEDGKIKETSFSTSIDDVSVAEKADEMLQKTLSNNSGKHMSKITQTIQPEQYALVSNDPDDDMIIQGVAGSGKTAIALHRLSYLQYNRQYSNKNILFISPNDSFTEYISNVFPELGSTRIPIKTIDAVADEIFGIKHGKGINRREESLSGFAEKYTLKKEKDSSVGAKFTKAFIRKFYFLCDKILQYGESIREYNKLVQALGEDIDREKRQKELYRDIIRKADKDIKSNQNTRDAKNTRKNAAKEWRKCGVQISKAEKKVDTLKRKLLAKVGGLASFDDVTKEASLTMTPEDCLSRICGDEMIRKYAYENLPYLYTIKFLIGQANGIDLENRLVKHIVVDEAQDYIEPHIFFLRQAFPNAVFTILGDKNQNINPFFKHSTLEDLLPDAKYYETNIAYRSSPEIVQYSNKILRIQGIEAKRDSQDVPVYRYTGGKLKTIGNTIAEDLKRYKGLGFKRIGIITRSQKDAIVIREQLESILDEKHYKMLIVLPVYSAKGLEYDAAIVINNFKKEEKGLLYVACTRAQHGLTVVEIK